jgi:hypothetical protein
LAAVPSVIGGPDCDFIGWRSERGGLARQQLYLGVHCSDRHVAASRATARLPLNPILTIDKPRFTVVAPG